MVARSPARGPRFYDGWAEAEGNSFVWINRIISHV